jgi:class 3 adenylate cyclase
MKTESTKKLLTIVFTDIVGYSGMMSRDEEKTLRLLEFHNRIAEEIVTGYHGKILKKLGDGLLITFNSVNDAYTASKLFQEEIKAFNTDKPESEWLLVRIGIHVGDVLKKEDDIFGNDVNVAARLQQICTPGGICLSLSAHAALGNSVTDEFKVFPKVALKNLGETYTVYQRHSIYPEKFPPGQNAEEREGDRNIKILSMKRIPPEKFSLFDSLFVSAGLVVILFFFTANVVMRVGDVSLNEAIMALSGNTVFLVFMLFCLGIFTLFILRSSVEIQFEDVRGADSMLSYIIQRFGFKPPVKKSNIIIFKPTLYNVLMWSTQKMRVSINGNHVTISGSFIFLRKVKKMLKTFQE